MRHLPILLPLLALATAPAVAEVESPIRPLIPAQSLRSGVGLQPAAEAGAQLVTGPDYSALIGDQGLELTPFLGVRAPSTQKLSLAFIEAFRGGVTLPAALQPGRLQALGTHLTRPLGGGVIEHLEASEAGVELAFEFQSRPAGQGDLVVRLALDSTFGAPQQSADGGLEFLLEGVGGVRIGGVTGIDRDGDRARGSMELVGSELLLSLPAEFVDQADYPMLLDPLVGSVLTVAPDQLFNSTDDMRPDLAYDASTDQYLIAWERAVSATESRIFARRMNGSGVFNNNAGQLSQTAGASRACHNVSVANVNRPNKFVVVWEMSEPALISGTSYSIQMLTLDANYSIFATHTSVFSTGGGSQLSPDVSGDGIDETAGVLGDFLIVWDDNANGRIAYRHYGFDQGGALDSSDAVQTLVNDNTQLFLFYSEPSIARASSFYGKTMVAYRRTQLLGSSSSIRGHAMNISGSQAGSEFLIAALAGGSVSEPNIDGFDRAFVCAWTADDGNGNLSIQAVPIPYNISNNLATVGTVVQVTNSSVLFDASKPAVGYSQGKTWIGWRSRNNLGPTSSIALKGFDSNTCAACEGSFTLATGSNSADEWVAVATPTSGGAYYDDRGCAVWSVPDTAGSDDVNCQLLSNNAQGGSYQNLGGGCGSAGTMGFNGAPSIGSSWWYTYLVNLPVTTLAAFYNITTGDPNLAIPCGQCMWLPFESSGPSVVQFDQIQGGTASAVAIIPCKPGLVGAKVNVQWTVFNPLTSPCLAFPSLSISDRWQVTIGQ